MMGRFIDSIIITLFVLYIAASSTISTNDIFSIIVTIFLIIVFFNRKLTVDPFIFILLTVWGLINFLSIILNGSENFNFITFIGVTIRMIMAYLMIKIVGINFFERFSQYAFKLVIISSVFFLLNLFLPLVFESLSKYLNFITLPEQKQAGGWYIFVYMFNAWAAPDRNSGFMWEPGAYAGVLIFLILYRLLINKFKLDKQLLILQLALLSTFSTAGYIALFVIILFLIIQNSNRSLIYRVFLPFTLIFVLFLGFLIFKETSFLGDKIRHYLDKGTESTDWSFQNQYVLRVSRLGIAVIEFESSLFRPFGNGILQSKYVLDKYGPVSGPNSLADILRQWGWLGILFMIYAFFIFTKIFTRSPLYAMCFILSMCIVLFSNPFLFKYLIYGIIFYSIKYRVQLSV